MFDPLEFPRLDVEGYDETSAKDNAYNCVSWAADESDKYRWWWPVGSWGGKPCYWPRHAPNKETITAFVRAFETLGFRRVPKNNPDLEPGYEKVAIYAIGNDPTHAARQLPNGKWTHKMGPCIDLETRTLTAVEGPKYGVVVRVLRRRARRR